MIVCFGCYDRSTEDWSLADQPKIRMNDLPPKPGVVPNLDLVGSFFAGLQNDGSSRRRKPPPGRTAVLDPNSRFAKELATGLNEPKAAGKSRVAQQDKKKSTLVTFALIKMGS